VARGNEKGRVERAIRYIRGAFFAARSFKDLNELNTQANDFCLKLAADRPWPEDPSAGSVRDAYQREQHLLLSLPDNPFPHEERIAVSIGKTPYARFDSNDYSVPYMFVRKQLALLSSLENVRILNGSELLAEHSRCWERHRQIENADRIEGLVKFKQKARRHRAQDRLAHAAPSSKTLFKRAASNGANLSSEVRALLKLLNSYSADELEEAIVVVLAHGLAHSGAVRQQPEKARYERSHSPAVELTLQSHTKLREVVLRTPSLQAYYAMQIVLGSRGPIDAPSRLRGASHHRAPG
jgi:hypothetical protein